MGRTYLFASSTAAIFIAVIAVAILVSSQNSQTHQTQVKASQNNVTIVTVGDIPCPLKKNGDFNCNDIVDLTDFDIWQNDFTNASVLSATPIADADGDGKATLVDYQAWREGYAAIK